MKLNAHEKEFVKQLSAHENEWVAVVRKNGRDNVVASGKRFREAKEAAEIKGYKDASLMKVPKKGKTLIPTLF